MIGEQDLRVVKCQDGARCRAGNIQMLDTTDPAVFVVCRAAEPGGKLLARPLPQVAILNKRDLGVRRERLSNEVAVTRSMGLEIKLDSVSWTILGRSRARDQNNC